MMYHSLLRIILTLFFLVGSTGLYSCCTQTYHYTGESEIYVYPAGDGRTQIDTVSSAFQLVAEIRSEHVALLKPVSFFNTAYALSCADEFQNFLDTGSTRLIADRPIVFRGDTIAVGTDLEESSLVKVLKESTEFANCRYEFTGAGLRNAVFESEAYTFTFEGRTSDGQILQCRRVLHFRL